MLDVNELTKLEQLRQRNTLNLIASENYPSPATLSLLGSVWSTKYAEGQPTKRYYAGNTHVDTLELECMRLAQEVFSAEGYGVNVQILSGSPANATVYHACLEVGDKVLSLSLNDGGHLSHLHSTSVYNKYFKFAHYNLKFSQESGYEIDIEDFKAKLQTHKPKLVILGCSAYPRKIDFKSLITISHQHGALVLADIAHINGLIAAGLHASPFASDDSGADFVTMTTHKTLRGPRSGLIFAKDEHMPIINKAIFPGSMGGPHLNKIAALTRAFQEITGEESYPDKLNFKQYQVQVLANCKALETGLQQGGLEIVTPTETHLCLIKLPAEMDSLMVQQQLEEVGIITNRNAIPHDTKSPWRPSGLRFGSAALTSRGANTEDMRIIASLIIDVIFKRQSLDEVKRQVSNIADRLSWFY
jgi:glycine hydroxymethyltransferase